MHNYVIIYSAYNPLTEKEEILAIADDADAVANISTDYSAGSIAIVADGGAVYMLDASGVWQVAKA